VCGDDPDPDINKDDVSKDKGKALSGGIAPSDGQEALNGHLGSKEPRFLEQFETRTFEGVWPEVEGIKSNVPSPDVDAAWRGIGEQLHTSVLNFESTLRTLSGSGGWEGQTIEAAYTNAMESTSEPFFTGTAALRGAELTHKFRDTLNYVHENLVKDPLGAYPDMWQRYQFDLNNSETPIEGAPGQQETGYEPTTAAEKAAIREYYNEYMRIVMKDSYIPGIKDIYGGYPKFVASTEQARPIDIPGLPQGPHKPGDTTSTGDGNGQPSIGGGGLRTPNLGGGTPSIPKTPGPSLQDGLKSLQEGLKQTKLPSDTDIPGRPGQNDQRPSLTDPSQTTGGLPSGLANAANQGLGAATQAASQAAKAPLNGLPKDLPKKPNVPEGALRLGKEGHGTGARGGGGSGGASLGGVPKGLPSGPAGLPAAATHAAAAGASQPGGANGPAMGPPGSPGSAGHGAGGAQQGKEHKVNKALRSRRRGIEIAGEAEAVVPVVGQDQEQDQQQDEAPTRRRPDPSRMPSTPSPATPVSTAEQERRQLRGRG
jgi:hypothetical protein